MSVIDTIRRMLRPPVYRTYVYGRASAFVDGMDVDELYRTQPQLRTVVSFIASNIAQLPLKSYVRVSDTDRPRDTDSDIAKLLRSPNPEQTTYELIYQLVSDLKLYDTALWIVSEDGNTDSGFIIRPIPPMWISGYEGGNLFAPEVVVIRNPETGAETRVPMSDAILWHGYDPSDPRYGSSPVESLRMILKEQIEAWSYRSQMWDRSARIPAYISRPLEAEALDDDDMDRFKTAWQDAYSKRGHGTGGTPVLEDGMTIKASPSMDFVNAQFSETITLSMETVCMAYHLKPGMITDRGQTYAAARDNARALYTDTLGPDLTMIAERLTRFLVKRTGADPRTYIEFDLTEKLNGSFLDMVQTLQSSVGAPWITRDEARAMVNRPAIGGDAAELIVPLNVVAGGLASPRDTTSDSYAAAAAPERAIKSDGGEGADKGAGKSASLELPAPASPPGLYDQFIEFEAVPDDAATDALRNVIVKFLDRQERSVLAAIGAAGEEKAAGDPDWWDAERWNRELADDMYPALQEIANRAGERTMTALGEDMSAWIEQRTQAYIRSIATSHAEQINGGTLRDLQRVLRGEVESGEKSTARGVFKYARGFRAQTQATTIATDLTCWAACEACKQTGREDEVLKQWHVTSRNPRESHIAMDGEIVPMRTNFSNGAAWPGDRRFLDVSDVAGCRCRLNLLLPPR